MHYLLIASKRAKKAERIYRTTENTKEAWKLLSKLRASMDNGVVPEEEITSIISEYMIDSLISQPVYPLSGIDKFNGHGIYAVYYSGDFSEYQSIVSYDHNNQCTKPIYVGKSLNGNRINIQYSESSNSPDALWRRLKEHTRAISYASNLRLADFHYQYFVTSPTWTGLGEQALVMRFQPLWNVVIDGFGSHNPGTGRYNMTRSTWDTIHPGRPWTIQLRDNELTVDQITDKIRRFLLDS